MNGNMKWLVGALAVAVASSLAPRAGAVQYFYEVWKEVYVNDADDASDEEKEFAAKVDDRETGRCFVCHVVGEKSRKLHNTYGIPLVELLDKKDFGLRQRRDDPEGSKEKVLEALKKVAAMHSVPDDEESPTFGELIAKGELPGKTPENLDEIKKELEIE